MIYLRFMSTQNRKEKKYYILFDVSAIICNTIEISYTIFKNRLRLCTTYKLQIAQTNSHFTNSIQKFGNGANKQKLNKVFGAYFLLNRGRKGEGDEQPHP